MDGQDGHDETAQNQQIVPLTIVNRGFTRDEVSPLKSPGGIYQPNPANGMYMSIGEPSAVMRVMMQDPWETLQWWESPWQARVGIGFLTQHPFFRLRRAMFDQTDTLIPTRMLYPYALQSSQEGRVNLAAHTVAAAIRQAREMYTAAQSAGVTDLARPLLYFYGALGLAKAAIAALFGAEALEEAHGLRRDYAPTVSSDQPDWPTLIEWQGRGQFAMLYRAARWDELYSCCYEDSRWQGRHSPPWPLRFHVLECIRALNYPWGTLPATGLARVGTALFDAQTRPGLLMPYRTGETPFLTGETPLETPLVQVPRLIVQYMLLYYFSILARYRPAQWQHLLAADQEREGYVFRVASEQVAHDFVHEIVSLLPNVPPHGTYGPEAWTAQRPDISDWYKTPEEWVQSPGGPSITVYTLPEWDGTPPDVCARATQLAGTLMSREVTEGEQQPDAE